MRTNKDWQHKYDHALDRLWKLFKVGMLNESELAFKLGLARDELERIKACPDASDEIKELCSRGLNQTSL